MSLLADWQTIQISPNCLMKGINKYLFIFIFVLLYPLSAFSASSVEIIAKQRVIIAQTRGIVTLPFNITNRGNKTQQFNEKIDLPEGWRLLTNSGFFTLAKGESTLRLVHVLAPSDVPAGKYVMPYQVVSKDNLSIRAEQEIAIVIQSLSKLSVEITEKPEIVLAGEQYTAKVSIRNNGNIPLLLTAKLKNTSSFPVTFTPKHFDIKPTEESVVTITAKIPTSLKESTFQTLKLSLNGDSISVDKTISTRIVSLTPKGAGYYHTIPSRITSTYTSSKDSNALQTEYSATGLLDENGEHHLDLLYRDMKTNDISSLGSDSEKRLAYDHSAISIRLGDYSFPLAGITSDGFYGEGLGINYHPVGKKWNLRLFKAQQGEDDGDSADISGFEVGYKFSKEIKVIINTLTLESKNNNPQKDTITGLDLSWEKYDAAEIRLSIAKGDEGQAFRLRQEGTLGQINYDYEIQKADTEFNGSINDIQSESIATSYAFNESKSYLRANVYHARDNLNNDTKRRKSEEKSMRFGVGHFFSNPLRDSLYAELYVRKSEDLRTLSDFNQVETGVRLQYQKSFSQNLRVNTTLEHVKTDNKLTNQLSKDVRGSLSLAYTPNEKYRFGAHIDTTNNSDNFGSNNENSFRFGLNLAVQLSSKQKLSGYWSSEGSYNNSMQFNYDYTFNNGTNFGASISNDTFNTGEKDLSYLLRVSIPFDTPLYRYKNISSLKGNVYNKALQQPVSNAIVEVAGQFAVTDKTGNYLFKAVREGDYAISTNLTKTNLNNYMVENIQQQRINLTANKASTHDIKLFQGTGIKGRIQAYKTSSGSFSLNTNSDNLIASGGIKNLLVTLTSQNKKDITHKVLTSEGGYFNFNGVKPGAWSIRVTDPSQVIVESRITEPQQLVQLNRGEEKTVFFKSVPLSRQIKKVGPSSGFSVSGE